MMRLIGAAGAILLVMTLLSSSSSSAKSPTTHPAIVSAQFTYESAPYPQCHASTIVETPRSSRPPSARMTLPHLASARFARGVGIGEPSDQRFFATL